MAITFVDATSARDGANDDVTVTAPTGIQDGDLLLGWYGCYGDTTDSAIPVTLTGFTKLTEKFETAGTDATLAVFYKIASSESGDYTFTGSHPATPETGACMAVFRGVDQSTPFDVTFVEGTHYVRNQNFGADDLTQPADITTNTDGAWCVILTHVLFANTTAFVPPAGFAEHEELIGAQTNMQICSKEQATAGAVGPGSVEATNSGDSTDASHYTLALKPASAASSVAAAAYHYRYH